MQLFFICRPQARTRISLSLLLLGLALVAGCRADPQAGAVSDAAGGVRTDQQGGLFVQMAMGHSHNDYNQIRPLSTALDTGMLSIEADVFLHRGDLHIAHDLEDIRDGRTLETEYLRPLWRAFQQLGGRDHHHPFGGRVRPCGRPVILLVDFKSDGEAAWPVLESQLARYAGMVRAIEADTAGRAIVTQAPVIVVVSGDCPTQLIAAASLRYSAIDGRYPHDADSDAPAHLIPMISSSLADMEAAAGSEVSVTQQIHLLSRAGRRSGRVARIWATPDDEPTWARLRDSGMQLINTDTPVKLSSFLGSDPKAAHFSDSDIHMGSAD